jgi:hypothetical protein
VNAWIPFAITGGLILALAISWVLKDWGHARSQIQAAQSLAERWEQGPPDPFVENALKNLCHDWAEMGVRSLRHEDGEDCRG